MGQTGIAAADGTAMMPARDGDAMQRGGLTVTLRFQKNKRGGEWSCLCGDQELEPKLGNGSGGGDAGRWSRREGRGRGGVAAEWSRCAGASLK